MLNAFKPELWPQVDQMLTGCSMEGGRARTLVSRVLALLPVEQQQPILTLLTLVDSIPFLECTWATIKCTVKIRHFHIFMSANASHLF